MPDDARRALLTRFFDHAPMFPPASLPPAEALAEDRRARASEHAWLLGRLVWPCGAARRAAAGRGPARSPCVEAGTERQDEAVYLEGVPLDEVAARGLRAKIRCGGERVPDASRSSPASSAAAARAGSSSRRRPGSTTRTRPKRGEHGFLNLLAAAVFGDEEEALRERPPAFALDADSFRWRDQEALPDAARRRARPRSSTRSARARSSSRVEELEQLGIL